MPISHPHKLIFVHIPKNGGSSIERALGIYGVDNQGDNRLVDESILFGNGLQHLTIRDILQRRPELKEQGYHSFAFVRNPWARAYSEYKWRSKWDDVTRRLSFVQFVDKELSNVRAYRHYWPQSDFLVDDSGELAIDFIGRLESIEADFARLAQNYGLDATEVPHVNRVDKPERAYSIFGRLKQLFQSKSQAKDGPTYRQQYNDAARQRVAELYRRDIELFGYEY